MRSASTGVVSRRSSRQVHRSIRRRRQLRFEFLENRLLLDGELGNVLLTPGQRQALLDGLQGVAVWSDSLAGHQRAAQPIALVGKSIGQELAMRGILQNQLVQRVAAASIPNTNALVDVLKNLSSTVGDLAVTVDPATVKGGLLTSPGGDELQFSLTFDAVRTRATGFDLGMHAQQAGLSLDASARANVRTDLRFDFTFGFDLTPGLPAAEAFFIRVNSLSLGQRVQETNWNVPGKVGILGVQVQAGTVDLAGALGVQLINPDADAKGNITLAELQHTSIGSLAGLTTTANTLQVALPLAATLGATAFPGSPAVQLTSSNIFSGIAPELAGNAAFTEMVHFANLAPQDLLTVLERVGSGLQQLAPSLDMNAALGGLPYLATQVSDVVDFGGMVRNVSRGLYDPVLQARNPLQLAAGGRLASNAVMTVRIQGDESHAITLFAASQGVGEDVARFFNRSLPPLLAGRLVASRTATVDGEYLTLRAVDPKITRFEILIGDRTNSATANLGIDPGQFSGPAFKFDTIQSFTTVLASLTGQAAVQVDPRYDPATHALSFAVNFPGVPTTQSVPFDFRSGLGPLTVAKSASASFTATPTAQARVGVELNGLPTVLTATGDGPLDGRLSATAHFSLTLNGGTPVVVTVARDATNTQLDDLVADLNASLTFAKLGQVKAGRNGNRLTLTSPTGSTLRVTAAAFDPATTELHLPGDGIGARWSEHVYLDAGAQVSVASQIVGANITGDASLGILPITIQQGSASIATSRSGLLTARTKTGVLGKQAGNAFQVSPGSATLGGAFRLAVPAQMGVSAADPATFELRLATPNQLATAFTATGDLPANGRLSANAQFTLHVGRGTPVNVVVPVDAGNQTPDDLVVDINAAIQSTRLGKSVQASRQGSRLQLATFGLDSLAIHSVSGDPTQAELRLPNTSVGAAVTYVANTPFQEKLAPVIPFGVSEFTQSVEGLLTLFTAGRMNHLTSRIPLIQQSVDEILGVSQKLRNVV